VTGRRRSVAPCALETAAFARDTSGIHLDGFHTDRAPRADRRAGAEQFVSAERDTAGGRAAENDKFVWVKSAREQSGPDRGYPQPLRRDKPLQRLLNPARHGCGLGRDRGRQRDAGIERLVSLLILLRADRDAPRRRGDTGDLRAVVLGGFR